MTLHSLHRHLAFRARTFCKVQRPCCAATASAGVPAIIWYPNWHASIRARAKLQAEKRGSSKAASRNLTPRGSVKASSRTLTPYSVSSRASSQASTRVPAMFSTPAFDLGDAAFRKLSEVELEAYLEQKLRNTVINEADKFYESWFNLTTDKLAVFIFLSTGPYLERRSSHLTALLMQKAAALAGASLSKTSLLSTRHHKNTYDLSLELLIPCISLDPVSAQLLQ